MTQQYRVLVPLYYPTDPVIIERLRAGENLPWRDRGHRRATAGAIVSDLPSISIPGLLAKGRIALVEQPPVAPAAPTPDPGGEPADQEMWRD